MLVPGAIGAAPGHPRAALALLVVRELSPYCTRGRREVDYCAASAVACDVVCPRWRCLTLSLNVLGPASNGAAVLVDMRQFAARLLRCLGWGARHGSARPSSSMETAECALWRFLSRPPHAWQNRKSCIIFYFGRRAGGIEMPKGCGRRWAVFCKRLPGEGGLGWWVATHASLGRANGGAASC